MATRLATAPLTPFDLLRPRWSAVHALPYDAVRTDSAIELSFDLPGYDPADVDLSVERNVLSLTATRSIEWPEDSRVLVAERRGGQVSRRIRFPESADLESVEARFDNGVLTVRVPLAEHAGARKVEISLGSPASVDPAVLEEGSATEN